MQLITNTSLAFFQTWDRDSSSQTKVVLVSESIDSGVVSLLAQPPYGQQVWNLVFTAAEVAELAGDIAKLLQPTMFGRVNTSDYAARRLLHTHRIEPQSGITITVGDTNQGEPYESGIRIEFVNASDYLTLEFDFDTARELVKALSASA